VQHSITSAMNGRNVGEHITEHLEESVNSTLKSLVNI